jgi:hypothetical protein
VPGTKVGVRDADAGVDWRVVVGGSYGVFAQRDILARCRMARHTKIGSILFLLYNKLMPYGTSSLICSRPLRCHEVPGVGMTSRDS